MPMLLAREKPALVPIATTWTASGRAASASSVPSVDPLSTTMHLEPAATTGPGQAVDAGQHVVAAVVADHHDGDLDRVLVDIVGPSGVGHGQGHQNAPRPVTTTTDGAHQDAQVEQHRLVGHVTGVEGEALPHRQQAAPRHLGQSGQAGLGEQAGQLLGLVVADELGQLGPRARPG